MDVRLFLGAILLLTPLDMCHGNRDNQILKQARFEDPKSRTVFHREVAADTYADHDDRLRVRRDTADTGQPAGVGFPLNDGLPPPGGQFPPFAPNGDPSTMAPSVDVTPSQTSADNASPLFCASYVKILICFISWYFLQKAV
ncbi:uncharacterized protein LOC110980050 isoform X2 [Acanthaster planci]|nr:uncharacterized protein LOC110980050 isoform X2 [Acanthaster planci]